MADTKRREPYDLLVRVLLDVYRVDPSTAAYSRLLEAALEGAIGLAGARNGSFYLRTGAAFGGEASESLQPVVVRGETHVAISQTIAAECLQSGQPIYIPIVGDSEAADIKSLAEQGTTSLICIPVMHRDEALGVLYMDQGPDGLPLGRRERNLMLLFAEGVGIAISRAGTYANLLQQVTRLDAADKFCGLVGRHPAIKRVIQQVQQIAASGFDPPVLIRGESGSGKELIARALHVTSRRRGGPFVPVNCAAIPAELFEAELFGYKAGAFTGATTDRAGLMQSAHGGTLFLDEIAELGPPLQAKLLRVLQEKVVQPVGDTRTRPVDVWVVSATHRDLREQIPAGRFREDLYYRITSTILQMPPLRERREDIPLLIATFSGDDDPPTFGPEVERLLSTYDWPGNVRELKNLVDHLRIFAAGEVVTIGDLPADLRPGGSVREADGATASGLEGLTMEEIKGLALHVAIEAQVRDQVRTDATSIRINKSALAKTLGVARNTIESLLKKHPVDLPSLITELSR